MTTFEPNHTGRPPGTRLKHFCLVVSTAAAVATPVIAWLAYLHATSH